MRYLATLLVACSLLAFSPQKSKKPGDVELFDTKVARDNGKITVDGKVRVTAEKGVRGLVIVFDFRSPEKEVVTSQKTVIDEGALETGREGVYHAEMADAVRAV